MNRGAEHHWHAASREDCFQRRTLTRVLLGSLCSLSVYGPWFQSVVTVTTFLPNRRTGIFRPRRCESVFRLSHCCAAGISWCRVWKLTRCSFHWCIGGSPVLLRTGWPWFH